MNELVRIANQEELASAISAMKNAGTDLSEYELKEAKGGFPKSVVDSVVAFANTNGGVIILGISEHTFKPVDIDVKLLQSQLSQVARERIEPSIQVDISVINYLGKPVVVANIPELPDNRKPCYVKKQGRVDGSYLRTGDGDYQMTLYEIDRFIENQRRMARNDIQIVADATIEDLDKKLLESWIDIQRGGSFGGTLMLEDTDLMVNRRIVAYDDQGVLRPTLAGLISLGTLPQKYFPRLNVSFTVYPTPVKGEFVKSGRRFVDSANIDGPIPAMLLESLRAISKNIKHGSIVRGGLRSDIPDYPMDAVREAVANALMHRDYSFDAHGMPVRVELYPDRLEIINPGGLFGPLRVENIETSSVSVSRNQFLSRILEDVQYTDIDGKVGRVVENRGTGYAIIEHSLSAASMDRPILQSKLSEFRIIFRLRRMNDLTDAQHNNNSMEESILSYLADRESASSGELAATIGVSVKTIRGYIATLLEAGIVQGIGSKYSPKRRYKLSE